MSGESKKIRGLMPDFSAFIATWSNRLMEIYHSEPIGNFWKMLKAFIYALPIDVKEEIKPLLEEVDSTLSSIRHASSRTDLKTTHDEHKRQYLNYLPVRAIEIWDKTHTLLDERGYKERESHRADKTTFAEVKAEDEDTVA